MIKFEYNANKATQAAAYLLKKNGGKMSHMKLIKELYLADRVALDKWGVTITGDAYFSMKQGPVLTNILDQMNTPEYEEVWAKYISPIQNNTVSLNTADINDDELSLSDKAILDEIFEKYKNVDKWELVKICHDTLPEWEDPGSGRSEIFVEDILKALGKDNETIEDIKEESELRAKEREVFS